MQYLLQIQEREDRELAAALEASRREYEQQLARYNRYRQLSRVSNQVRESRPNISGLYDQLNPLSMIKEEPASNMPKLGMPTVIANRQSEMDQIGMLMCRIKASN